MKHGTQINLHNASNEELRMIFIDALLSSYYHRCEKFDPAKGYNRSPVYKSAIEVIDECLQSKLRLFTVIYRDTDNRNIPHWEFSPNNIFWYVNIEVRPDLAEKIFERFNLKSK